MPINYFKFSTKKSRAIFFSYIKIKGEGGIRMEEKYAWIGPACQGVDVFIAENDVSRYCLRYQFYVPLSESSFPALFLPRPFKFAEALRLSRLEGVARLKNR